MRENRYYMPEREPSERFSISDAGPLSLRDLVVMGLAFIMPIIPFVLYGDIMKAAHGASASAFWIAAITVGVSLFSFIRLTRTWTGPASVYNGVSGEFNSNAGFVVAWAQFIFYMLVPATALMMSANIIHDSANIPAIIVIIAFIACAFAINYIGSRLAAKFCMLALIIIVAFTLIYIFACVLAAGKGAGVGQVVSSVPYKGVDAGFGSVLMGSGVVVLAFLGFESSVTLSAEAERDRNLPGKAFVITCIIAGIFIFLQIYVSGLIVPYSTETANATILDVAAIAGGKVLSLLYSTAIIIAGLLALIAGQSAAARLIYALGRSGAIPRHIFARRDANPNPARRVPLINLIAVSLVTLILCIFSSQAAALAGLARFMGAFVMIAVNLTMLVYGYFGRRDGNIITALIVPAVGFLGSLTAWINVAPKHFLIGLLWIAVGAILSGVVKNYGGGYRHQDDNGGSNTGGGNDSSIGRGFSQNSGTQSRKEKREKNILADKDFQLPRRDRRF